MEELILLDGEVFRRMVFSGYSSLEQQREAINQLNVFPVPDGDTGTNLVLTLEGVIQRLRTVSSRSLSQVAEIVARESLLSARGNSGVILSEMLRGWSRGLAGKEWANTKELARAFRYGIVYAYRAVAKPVEGTILSVAREIACNTKEAIRRGMDFPALLEAAIQVGEQALARTPDQLPILKRSGVVDAGAKGLLTFLQGCQEGLLNGGLMMISPKPESSMKRTTAHPQPESKLRYKYCAEVLVVRPGVKTAGLGRPGPGRGLPKDLRKHLEKSGDSLVLVEDKDLLKIHIHTNHPGKVLETALRYGELMQVKVDHMGRQHQQLLEQWEGGREEQGREEGERPTLAPERPAGTDKVTALVAVASGPGIASVFRSLGVDVVVPVGAFANVGVGELLQAINKVAAREVIVFPNDANNLLAAQEAARLAEEKKVEIVPTTNVAQCLSALVAYAPEREARENSARMHTYQNAAYGEITRAAKDAQLGGWQIAKGDFLGLGNEKILAVGEELAATTLELLRQLILPRHEALTVFYGQGIEEGDCIPVVEWVRQTFPQVEVELVAGGQEAYPFLFCLE